MMHGRFDIFERIYSSHWFLSSYNGPGFVYDFPRIGGGAFITKAIYIMEQGMCRYVFDADEFEQAANYTSARLLNDHRWRRGVYGKINFYTKKYFAAGEQLRSTPLDSLPDSALIRMARRIIEFQHWHQVYSVLANGVVLDGRNHLSNKIRKELQSIIGNDSRFDEHWSLLTQITAMSVRQKKEYAIARLARQSRRLSHKTVERRLGKLHERYCWLDYNNIGPAASLNQFRQELVEAIQGQSRADIPKQLASIKEKQANLIRTLRINSRGRFLIKLAQGVIWQKGYRKDMQYHGFYCYEHIFRTLATRAGTDDWQSFSYLFPWEVESYLLHGLPTLSELQDRRKYSCFIVTKEGKEIKIGFKAKSFVSALGLLEDFFSLREVKGQCAFSGKVAGAVKIIQVPADMEKMAQGDILVSQATSPDLLPAMRKAGAIVTNTGGLICHAAITSRELKIPCVVGTAKATLVFKDGEKVEVDATKGIVRKL